MFFYRGSSQLRQHPCWCGDLWSNHLFIRYKHAIHYFTNPCTSTAAGTHMLAQCTHISNTTKQNMLFISDLMFLCLESSHAHQHLCWHGNLLINCMFWLSTNKYVFHYFIIILLHKFTRQHDCWYAWAPCTPARAHVPARSLVHTRIAEMSSIPMIMKHNTHVFCMKFEVLVYWNRWCTPATLLGRRLERQIIIFFGTSMHANTSQFHTPAQLLVLIAAE